MYLYGAFKFDDMIFRFYLIPASQFQTNTVAVLVQPELKVKFVATLSPNNFPLDPLTFFPRVLDMTTNREFDLNYRFMIEGGRPSASYTSSHNQLLLSFSNNISILFKNTDFNAESDEVIERVIQLIKNHVPQDKEGKKTNENLKQELNGKLENLLRAYENSRTEIDALKQANLMREKKEKEREKEKKKREREEREFIGSTILDDNQKAKLKEWSGGKKWKLIYKGSKHGFQASTFHSNCNNKGETITVVLSNDGYIFGGYTSIAWISDGNYRQDNNAWLFTLTNPEGTQPVKLPITQNHGYAIYDYGSYGPTFGGGNDLCKYISFLFSSFNI